MKTQRVKNRFWSPSLKSIYKNRKATSKINHKKNGLDKNYYVSPYMVCLPGLERKNKLVEID